MREINRNAKLWRYTQKSGNLLRQLLLIFFDWFLSGRMDYWSVYPGFSSLASVLHLRQSLIRKFSLGSLLFTAPCLNGLVSNAVKQGGFMDSASLYQISMIETQRCSRNAYCTYHRKLLSLNQRLHSAHNFWITSLLKHQPKPTFVIK